MASFFYDAGSVTNAYRAQKILLNYGITCRVIKVTDSKKGCTHGLQISGNRATAMRLLSGIK